MELIKVILSEGNLDEALRRVKANKGASGIDKMPVSKLDEYFKAHKDEIIELNLKLNKSKIHSFLIHYFFNDKKMIRTYPNLKQEKLDGTIVYFKDLLPDIKPYYYKFVAKDFYK